ncbi:MAG: GcrA family cell cycle regulator [Rhizobiaceae bacterium]
MSWSDDRVELLRKLWLDGLSASQIAAELGSVTRNAVIGKVHRLGLSGRTRPGSSTGNVRPKRIQRTPAQAPRQAKTMQRALSNAPMRSHVSASADLPDMLPASLVAPDPLKLELTQLSETTCKWPIGDPATEDFYFCGHGSKEGSPYCAFHSRVAYQPLADRRNRDRRAIGR